jgi:glutamine amidotransferase
MISVVTYGVGNVGSIFSMLRKIGVPAKAAATPDEIGRAEKIILPGVGAFDHGMSMLADRGLNDAIVKRVGEDGIPLLGICLGMQLLGRCSEEGSRPGLGLVDAQCVRFRAVEAGQSLKVPHMGWNDVMPRVESPLLAGLDAEPRFYFVHSYHVVCANPADVVATSRYGVDFTAVLRRDNVWGAQFHPEKSHRFGMTVLRNFSRL